MMKNFERDLPKILGIQLFEDFNADDDEDVRLLSLLYDNFSLREYDKDETIIREGDFGDLFYILLEGSIHIFRNTPAGDKIALANLCAEQNIFFGETALISKDSRNATVVAASFCRAIALSSRKFHSLCQKEPLLGYRVVMKIAGIMANTIRKTNSDKATLYEALFNEIEFGE